MAFDLKEPWATHRQYQVFGDKHTEIFGRQEVGADRIVMCQVIMDAVTSAASAMKNQLCAKYILTRYFIMYTLRLISDNDPIAKDLLLNPSKYVRDGKDRNDFRTCMRRVTDDVVVDLNLELEPLGVDFDYRDKMRDSDWVKNLAKQIVALRIKLVQRGTFTTLKAAWDAR